MLVVLLFQLPFSFLEDKFHEGGKLRTEAQLETLSNWHRAGLPNKAAREAAIETAREVFLRVYSEPAGPEEATVQKSKEQPQKDLQPPLPQRLQAHKHGDCRGQ